MTKPLLELDDVSRVYSSGGLLARHLPNGATSVGAVC